MSRLEINIVRSNPLLVTCNLVIGVCLIGQCHTSGLDIIMQDLHAYIMFMCQLVMVVIITVKSSVH